MFLGTQGRLVANKAFKDLLGRVRKAGFDRSFVEAAVLPDWWSADCEEDVSLLPDLQIRVARFLDRPLSDVRDPKRKLESPVYANARLRRVASVGDDQLGATIHAALSIAAATLRCLRAPLPAPQPPPVDPSAWHTELGAGGGGFLNPVTRDLWARGIPVIQVEVLPSPRFQGLACILDGRPVILIGHDIDVPARLLSHVAHEAGHIAAGDCAENAPVVDESDEVVDRTQMERNADRYAVVAALGEEPPEPPSGGARTDFRRLASVAAHSARNHGVDVGSLLWFWTARTREFPTGVMALKALYKHRGGADVLRAQFDANVDLAKASETDRALLRCVKGDPDRDAALG